MPSPETLIYAELLSNIRQISIIVILPTLSDNDTKVELSSNRRQLYLQHRGQQTLLTLPGQVASNALLQWPTAGKQELSWRLPIAGQVSRPDDFASDAEAPWAAKELAPESEFLCRECKSIVLGMSTVKIWKDLPSENWAEMMEFWHCHKPDDKPDQEPNGSSDHHRHVHSHTEDPNAHRGYGASSRFAATKGVGFVDISTFLVAETDCQNITSVTSSQQAQHSPITCSNCTTSLGHNDHLSSGLRLYKWLLQLRFPQPPLSSPHTQQTPPPPATLPPIALYTTHFATTMHSQATSRLLLSPLASPPTATRPTSRPPTKTAHLNLWILSPSIHYSAALTPSPSLSPSPPSIINQHAMKIFYTIPTEAEAEELGKKDGVEEIFFPIESIQDIKKTLEESQKYLPPSGRTFRELKVGLLERF